MEEQITLDSLLENKLLQLDKKLYRIPAESPEVATVTAGGVYQFKGVDDQLLYVGLTDNIARRVTAHLRGGGSPDIFCYNHSLLEVEFFLEDDPLFREFYESYLIYTLNPRYNIKKTTKKKIGVR